MMKANNINNCLPYLRLALLLGATCCLAEETCCLRSNGKEDPCNPNKYTCWPMDRVARWAECGRREDTDCKYDVQGAVHDKCCYGGAGLCLQEGGNCYTISSFSSQYSEWDYKACTEDYFMINNYAPSTGFEGTVCGNDGFGGLDPHFETWNGTWYDYMGVCDLVFLHAPEFGNGRGLEIHIRTKEDRTRELSNPAGPYQFTFVESVALKIGENSNDIFQVDSWGQYRLNGQENPKLPAELAGFRVDHVVVAPGKRERFMVWLGSKERIVISVVKELVSVSIKGATYESFGTSKGLMGAFGSGTKLARNNTPITDDDNLFAEEWQVRDTDDILFAVSRHPQYPQQCIKQDATVVKNSIRRRLSVSTVSKQAAEAACAHVKYKPACINDVMAMENLDLADEFPQL